MFRFTTTVSSASGRAVSILACFYAPNLIGSEFTTFSHHVGKRLSFLDVRVNGSHSFSWQHLVSVVLRERGAMIRVVGIPRQHHGGGELDAENRSFGMVYKSLGGSKGKIYHYNNLQTISSTSTFSSFLPFHLSSFLFSLVSYYTSRQSLSSIPAYPPPCSPNPSSSPSPPAPRSPSLTTHGKETTLPKPQPQPHPTPPSTPARTTASP